MKQSSDMQHGASDNVTVPKSEIDRRIAQLQRAMGQAGLDAMFIVQRVDLFYFSGTAQNGYLYVPAEGDPLLLIRKYMPRAEAESALEHKVRIRSVKEVPHLIADLYGKPPDVLGFEFDVMPVREFYFYRQLLSPGTCVDGSPLIHNIRMIKSTWELACMEQTAALSGRVFEYIRSEIRPGFTEIEFAGMYETFARKIGHDARVRVRDYQTEGYNWHILSGESGGVVGLLDAPASGRGTSAAAPCGGSSRLLARGEPIMIDLATVHNGYHMDETRMFAMGSLPKDAQEASKAAIDIHQAVIDKVKPGVTAGQLFEEAVDRATALGYADVFLGPADYKVTFVGHGLGLELVEPPFIARGRKDRLEPGMTFALEPKMVFENRFAAGVESVFCVTHSGARLLSRVPVKIFIC
jgi:Xaa-Pro aminopeptidase